MFSGESVASISQGNSFLALSPEAGDTPWVSPAVHSFPTSSLVPPRGCVMVYFILTLIIFIPQERLKREPTLREGK